MPQGECRARIALLSAFQKGQMERWCQALPIHTPSWEQAEVVIIPQPVNGDLTGNQSATYILPIMDDQMFPDMSTLTNINSLPIQLEALRSADQLNPLLGN